MVDVLFSLGGNRSTRKATVPKDKAIARKGGVCK